MMVNYVSFGFDYLTATSLM